MIIKDLKNPECIPTRNGYGEGLVQAGKLDKNVVVLTADLSESTRANYFQEKFPERFIEVGVAEQNLTGIAAGLALSGKVPFVSSYAVFSPGRSWDQLRISVCYQKANVKIAGAHTGISVGPDGATHQALEDIAITRCLPNLIVIAPCDVLETKKATLAAAKLKGPVYLRFTRNKSAVFTTPKSPFKIGQAQVFRPGKDVTIVACGPLVYDSLLASDLLKKQGISTEVINNHTIKPLDVKTILNSVKKTSCLVTVEEHQVMGGMGSAVIEGLAKSSFVPPTEMVGMPDSFGESGTQTELLNKYHMNVDSIVKAAKTVLARKKNFTHQ